MQVDYSVELGRDDPVLEFPWSSPDGSLRYVDLKRDAALVAQISEAADLPDLRAFLVRMNAAGFPLQTAKCDCWMTKEILPEEEIFAARQKFVTYCDLLFTAGDRRVSFARHEQLAKELCVLLQRAPEMAASVDLVIRRCVYHAESAEAGLPPAAQSGSRTDEKSGASLDEKRSAPVTEEGRDEFAGDSGDGSVNGFCITAYVSGFGNTDEESRRSWSIAIKLLQHALVQVTRDQ